VDDPVVASYAGNAAAGIGVLCTVEAISQLGDGAVVVTLRGERRVAFEEVSAGGEPDTLDRARVTIAEEAGSGTADARALAVGRARRYLAGLTELGYASDVLAEFPENPIHASYRLASVLRISEPERQFALECPTAADRLGLLATVFERERVLVEATISAGGR
jgi:Lon protease-like protein